MRTSDIPIFTDPGLPSGYGVATVEINPGVFRLRLVPLTNLKGDQGDAGPAGATGPQGPTGPKGNVGGVSFLYQFDTNTVITEADPGFAQFDNAAPGSATALVISRSDRNANDLTAAITGTIAIGDYVILYDESDFSSFLIFQITGGPTLTGASVFYDVSPVYGSSVFSDNQNITLSVSKRGPAGANGATGADGADGVAGQTGGLSFNYDFDTGLASPPASGEIRLNNASFGSVTQMFVHGTTSDALPATNVLTSVLAGSYLVLFKKSNPTNFAIYQVTALLQTTVVEFNVDYITSNGAAFADGDDLVLSVAMSGPEGPSGPQGPQGDPGPTGATGAAGSVWREGTGAPSNGLGVNGDFYLDDATGDVYQKAAGAYTVVANIKGATGATGPEGSFAHSVLTYAATTNIDFDGDDYRSLTLTGNVTFTTSNRGAPKSITIRIIGDASDRTLTFPGGWKWYGDMPSALAANKEGILSVTCFGSNEADVRAAYASQN